MAKQKWYVVWQGRDPGIYTSWADCQRQVKGVSGAKFKSFPTEAEASAAFSGGGRSGVAKGAKAGGAKKSRSKPGGAEKAPLAPVDLELYCDGACDPNPGPAGSGVAVYRNGALAALHYGLYTPQGTNNTAELHALLESLKLAREAVAAGESVRIRADSSYALKAISEWAPGWKKRGWRRANGDPVKNPDIIKPAFELYQEIGAKIELAHVKGHSGIEGNELADRMAMLAATQRQRDFVSYEGELDVSAVLALKRG